jgi:hypothetical protein
MFTTSAYDDNRNDWIFNLESKKDSVRSTYTQNIFASDTIDTYYIRLERSSQDSVRLTVCTDPLFTNNLTGSPETFACDPSITGLQYVQQGNFTPGFNTREINAVLSDLSICSALSTGITQINTPVNLLALYPNPATSVIHIEWLNANAGEYLLTLSSTDGRVLDSESLAANTQQATLSTSQLAAGMYFISLIDGQGVRCNKVFVKE